MDTPTDVDVLNTLKRQSDKIDEMQKQLASLKKSHQDLLEVLAPRIRRALKNRIRPVR